MTGEEGPLPPELAEKQKLHADPAKGNSDPNFGRPMIGLVSGEA
jgi:hypothetical protein